MRWFILNETKLSIIWLIATSSVTLTARHFNVDPINISPVITSYRFVQIKATNTPQDMYICIPPPIDKKTGKNYSILNCTVVATTTNVILITRTRRELSLFIDFLFFCLFLICLFVDIPIMGKMPPPWWSPTLFHQGKPNHSHIFK